MVCSAGILPASVQAGSLRYENWQRVTVAGCYWPRAASFGLPACSTQAGPGIWPAIRQAIAELYSQLHAPVDRDRPDSGIRSAGHHHPEPVVVVAVARIVVVAVSRPAVVGIVVPATAPQNTVGTLFVPPPPLSPGFLSRLLWVVYLLPRGACHYPHLSQTSQQASACLCHCLPPALAGGPGAHHNHSAGFSRLPQEVGGFSPILRRAKALANNVWKPAEAGWKFFKEPIPPAKAGGKQLLEAA